jgi:hypothetical protein
MKTPQIRWLCTLVLGLVIASAARAQSYWPGQPAYGPLPAPRGWAPPYYAYPQAGYPPAAPAYSYTAAPAPAAVLPPQSVIATTPQTPQAPGAAVAPAAPAAQLPMETPADALTRPSSTLDNSSDADAGFLGTGTLMTASSLGMQGRADAGNRFNIFDNMAALPTNRIWYAYQYMDHFNPGVSSGDSALLTQRNVNLYRFGTEICLNSSLSISIQDQYIDSAGSPDSWGNLQVLFKYAFINEDRRVWSAVIGVSPQSGDSPDELHERTTRFYGGFLFFRAITCDFFVQGGGQVDIATNDLPQTLDYALSFGYWLYRNPHLDTAGRPIDEMAPQFYSCCHHWIWGVIPQVELLGKYVMANRTGAVFDTFTPSSFSEGKDVIDLTLGGRILFTPHISLGSAFSLPLTGPFVRKGELTTSLNIGF